MGHAVGKAGKFVKKHPLEAAALGATAGFGGAGLAGMGPLAGLLGAGAVPEIAGAGTALAGASGLTDLAGATGGALASTPSVMPPLNVEGGLKGLATANKVTGLLGMNQPQQTATAGSNPFANQPQLPPTRLPALGPVGSMAGIPPAPPGIDPKMWMNFFLSRQQQQGASYG